MRCPLCPAELDEATIGGICRGCLPGWISSPEFERQYALRDEDWALWLPVADTAEADYVRRVQAERANGGRV